MKTKLKLKDIILASNGLGELVEKDLPIKAAYNTSKLARALKSILEVYAESEQKMFKKYGKETDPGQWQIAKKNINKFQEDFSKLRDNEEEVEFTPIDITDLENVEIKPSALVALEPFIKQ